MVGYLDGLFLALPHPIVSHHCFKHCPWKWVPSSFMVSNCCLCCSPELEIEPAKMQENSILVTLWLTLLILPGYPLVILVTIVFLHMIPIAYGPYGHVQPVPWPLRSAKQNPLGSGLSSRAHIFHKFVPAKRYLALLAAIKLPTTARGMVYKVYITNKNGVGWF